jgi:hypothetical protein
MASLELLVLKVKLELLASLEAPAKTDVLVHQAVQVLLVQLAP